MSNSKNLVVVFLGVVLLSTSSFATTYYFSNSGSATNNGTATATPLPMSELQKTLNNKVKAGDSVLFKAGEEFTAPSVAYGINTFSATFNATAAAPVTFGGYGTGTKPNFIFPNPTSVNVGNRTVFTIDDNYVVFDGLSFNDKRFPATDYTTPAYTSDGIRMEADHGVIKNCEFNNIGNAIDVTGDFNLVTKNKITDLKSIINTATPTTEDYGATAFTNVGSNNTYSYNYVKGAWAGSLDFIWNGATWEMYEGGSNNLMIYNTIIDAGGIAEYGSSSRNNHAENDTFAYNLIINCGDIFWMNGLGYAGFAEDVRNISFINNTVIENTNSRFSGPNAGAGLPSSYTNGIGNGESKLFGYGGKPVAVWAIIKNNVFILNTGVDVASGDSYNGITTIIHENNIYNVSGSGGTIGYALNTVSGKTEYSTTNAIITSQTPPASTSCLSLSSTSPAINIAVNLGYTIDLNNAAVGTSPDAGCAEYGSGGAAPDVVNPVVSFTAPTASSTISGTKVVSVNATDNSGMVSKVEFFYGTTMIAVDNASPFSVNWNTTTVTDNNYTLNAKAYDAAGNMGTASITVTVKNVTADTTKPAVSFTSPANASTISATKALTATATDANGITKVEFYDGGTLLNTDTTSPYSFNWNTATVSNGEHTLYAKAYDPSGNMQTASVIAMVSNTTSVPDATAPIVSFTEPVMGSFVTGLAIVTATASDNSGAVSKVEFYDGGILLFTDTTSPYSIKWDTVMTSDGNHTLFARAYDAKGNVGATTSVVTVTNLSPVINAAGAGAVIGEKPEGTSSGLGNSSVISSSGCQSNGSSSMLLFMLPILFLVARRRRIPLK